MHLIYPAPIKFTYDPYLRDRVIIQTGLMFVRGKNSTENRDIFAIIHYINSSKNTIPYDNKNHQRIFTQKTYLLGRSLVDSHADDEPTFDPVDTNVPFAGPTDTNYSWNNEILFSSHYQAPIYSLSPRAPIYQPYLSVSGDLFHPLTLRTMDEVRHQDVGIYIKTYIDQPVQADSPATDDGWEFDPETFRRPGDQYCNWLIDGKPNTPDYPADRARVSTSYLHQLLPYSCINASLIRLYIHQQQLISSAHLTSPNPSGSQAVAPTTTLSAEVSRQQQGSDLSGHRSSSGSTPGFRQRPPTGSTSYVVSGAP